MIRCHENRNESSVAMTFAETETSGFFLFRPDFQFSTSLTSIIVSFCLPSTCHPPVAILG